MDNNTEQLLKIPSLAEAVFELEKLKGADFSKCSIQKVNTILTNKFGIVPVCEGKINVGSKIIRLRISSKDELFHSEMELSYRPDSSNIKNYGRASVPGTSVFYGVLVTGSPEAALETAIGETHEIFRNSEHFRTQNNTSNIPNCEFYCTIGMWNVIQPITAVHVLFCKNYLNKVEWINNGYNNFLNSYKSKYNQEQVETIKLLLEFYSDEFARNNINSHTDYIFSAAYSNYVAHNTGSKCIVYPSVRNGGHGVNIAMSPAIVEWSTELEVATKCHVINKSGNIKLTPIMESTEFGAMNSRFNWKNIQLST